jgi:hypothetical protein
MKHRAERTRIAEATPANIFVLRESDEIDKSKLVIIQF